MSIKSGISEIIGKTVNEVIVNEGCPYPDFHIFILFEDSTCYEIYGSDVNSGSCLRAVTERATKLSSCRKITRYYKDQHGENASEDLT